MWIFGMYLTGLILHIVIAIWMWGAKLRNPDDKDLQDSEVETILVIGIFWPFVYGLVLLGLIVSFATVSLKYCVINFGRSKEQHTSFKDVAHDSMIGDIIK